jgi:hypothetical protein
MGHSVAIVMKRRVAVLLAAASLLLALSAAFAWSGSPAWAGSGSGETVFMSTEAWYDEPPPCVSLIDCSTVPATSPYPKETLHVSVSGGQETARTYLEFDTAPAPGETLIGGTLTLPIDDAAADGSLAPDQATFQACAVTKSFKPVRGSTEKPPAVDCHVFSLATYDKKAASFTVDLLPLALQWSGRRAALALVPAKEGAQPGATWHVVFHATTKPAKDAPPITATLQYSEAPSSGPSPAPLGGTGTSGGGSFGSTGGGGGSFSSSFPRAITRTTTTTTTAQAPAAPGLVGPVSLEGFAGPGFAYPTVWALPLLILVGIGALGRALTKELYRRGI